MTRTHPCITRSLIVAASLAVAGGLAQAQTFDSPQIAGEASTMTNGAPNLVTDNPGTPSSHVYLYSVPSVPYSTVMGAGPAVTYTYGPTYYVPSYSYSLSPEHSGASETSNTPLRAGEASTMTNGAPNVQTQN